MPKTFSVEDPLTVAEVVFNSTDLANQPLNSFAVPTKVSLYAVATVADVQIIQFQIGAEIHSQNLTLPVAAAVSMRDHLIAQGVVLPGSKLGISYRAVGAGTPTFRSVWVLEELA